MKFGICSEIFKEWEDIERAMAFSRETGYDGFEIAPFTLAQYVTDIPASTRSAIVRQAHALDLDIIGLHWLLVGPEGMHLTHPDREVRTRTASYLADLTRFCCDVGGKVMVFGSPRQRNLCPGVSYTQAMDHAREVFLDVLPVCEECGVTLCMEPLTTEETDFCASAEATLALVQSVNHPHFRMMLDAKAMSTEEEDRPTLIRRFAPWLGHFHANDPNLNGPGWGDLDFGPLFDALREIHYDAYLSVEVFDFEPGPETIARKSIEYLRRFV